MAEPPGMKYVALVPIDYPKGSGVRAYNPGDLVHESAVEGDTAWLTLDEDVKPREGVSLSRPSPRSSHAAWAAYAASTGEITADDAEGLPKKELVARFGEPPAEGG